MNLFEISVDHRAIILRMEEWAENHDGDITEFPLKDELNALEGTMEDKALAIGVIIKELTTFGNSIIGEGAPFMDLAKAYDTRGTAKLNQAKRLKEYLADTLPNPFKVENSKVRVRRQGSGGKDPVVLMEGITPEMFPVEFHKPQPVELAMDVVLEKAVAAEQAEVVGVPKGARVIIRESDNTLLATVGPKGTHIRVE